jgi:hypothetical protein
MNSRCSGNGSEALMRGRYGGHATAVNIEDVKDRQIKKRTANEKLTDE